MEHFEAFNALLSSGFRSEMIPIILAIVGVSGIGLPLGIFGAARKWSQDQPDLAGPVIGGAVVISLVSVLVCALVILALIGWLPSPLEWVK